MNSEDFLKNRKKIMSCPVFQGMSEKEAEEILSGEAVICSFKDGQILDSDCMYIILSGCIQIEKDASDGRRILMSSALSGAAVNVASVFEPGSRMSVLVAQKDISVVMMTREAVLSAVRKGGQFTVNLIRFLTGRIVFLNSKITSLAGYSAAGRLKMYLEENAEEGEITIPMNLSEFADYLGVGRASLYRALDSLEESGAIERKGRKVIIRNL